MSTHCPACGKPVTPESGQWPFCSERCSLIDLGDWLSGRYSIPDKEQHELWNESVLDETRH